MKLSDKRITQNWNQSCTAISISLDYISRMLQYLIALFNILLSIQISENVISTLKLVSNLFNINP